jgi:hypothetical protein
MSKMGWKAASLVTFNRLNSTHQGVTTVPYVPDSTREQTKQSPLQYGRGDGRDPEEAGLLHQHEMLAVAHAHCDELTGAGDRNRTGGD